MTHIATTIAAVAIVASACTVSPSQPAPTANPGPGNVPSTTSTVLVATEPVDDNTPSSAPSDEAPTPTLAERITPVGSALYDPTEHAADTAVPISVTIESIGVADAAVIDVGVTEDNEMEIPDADGVGWYRFNPAPGEPGSAVLAAHVSYNGSPGVFHYLADVEIGDEVSVALDDGTVLGFRVVETARYPKSELPVERVFAKDGPRVLTLITCGGDFNRSERSYEDNIVAYAVPISPPPGADAERGSAG